MNRTLLKIFFIAVLASFLAGVNAQAIPMQFNLSLSVSQANQNFSGTVVKDVTIKLYRTGQTTPLWTEIHPRVSIVNGDFRILVGSIDTASNPIRSEYLNSDFQFSVTIEGEEAFWAFNAGTVYALKSAIAEKALAIDWANVTGRPTALSDLGTVASANLGAGSVTMAKISRASASLGQILKWNGTAWAPAADDGGTSYSAGAGLTLSRDAFSLAPGAVTTNALSDSAVTTAKINNGAITSDKLASGILSHSSLGLGEIATRNSRDFVTTRNLTTQLAGYLSSSRQVNGHVLSADLTLTKSDLSLGNVENTTLSTWAGSTNLTTLGTLSSGTWQGTAIADAYVANDITLTNLTQITNRAISDTTGTLAVARGGTGATTAAGARTSLGLGEIATRNSRDFVTTQNLTTQLAGYLGSSRQVNGHALSSDLTLTKSDLSLGNVENTALSTWAGSPNLTTVGTLSSGTWQGTAVADAYVANDITLTNLTQITNRAISDTTGTLAVARGGTGATSASSARTNLGLGTIATRNSSEFVTLTYLQNTWPGSTRIRNVGTIYSGSWQAEAIAVDSGGTGADNIADARTNLGLGEIATRNSRDFVTTQNLTTQLAGYLSSSRQINGHALTADLTLTKSDLSLGNVENTTLSTWAGSTNLTTLGTISTWTWRGTAVADAYVANDITLTNLTQITTREISDTTGTLAVARGGTGATVASTARTNLGLGSVENTALSTWAGSTNLTTLGTISSGTWSGTTVAVAKGGTGATTAAGARTSLGVGEIATRNSSDFITPAQLTTQLTGVAVSAITTKSANYTATGTNDGIILYNTTDGAYTLTLPSATSNPSRTFKVKKITSDFNTLTISSQSGSLIEGGYSVSSSTISTRGESIEIVSDGTNWQIISRVIPDFIYNYDGHVQAQDGTDYANATTYVEAVRKGHYCVLSIYTFFDGTPSGTSSTGFYWPIPTGLGSIESPGVGRGDLIGMAFAGKVDSTVESSLHRCKLYYQTGQPTRIIALLGPQKFSPSYPYTFDSSYCIFLKVTLPIASWIPGTVYYP